MITLNINGQTRDGVDESWVAQRVEGLRRDGQSICVNVLAVGLGGALLGGYGLFGPSCS